MNPAQVAGISLGLWLMAAPAVLSYAGTSAGDLHRVVGPCAARFALIAVSKAVRGVRLCNLVAAAVLVAAPVFVAHPGGVAAVGVASGLALGAATPSGGTAGPRTGDGWRAVAHRNPSPKGSGA